MHFFGYAFMAAAFLFAGPSSIFALPTAKNAAVVSSLQDALEALEDNSMLERRDGHGFQVPRCNPGKYNLKLPLGEGSPKLTDAGSLKLKLLAIGHGTQNYTCADSTAKSKPVANGAYAELYDVSCFPSVIPGILNWLPYLFLHKPRAIPVEKLPKVGVHYFYPDASTPVFDVNEVTATAKKGRFVGMKSENITAPSGANTGVAPNAFGAVDWLKLVSTDNVRTASGRVFASNGYKAVYRVETAGGRPPATCQGRPTHFEILYAAQYWLYN
ncbi:hypothetical protein L211DRAFT_837530 [Terfezia boudieri ATCC MYA-4762]|uniref:Malate dehydrogenase n=1 Tax=Terfezia boudieri ATCC MYA-4762 TaxID=1051890 RepID=A0A3N4LP19_9PEZI|nr:hypothetical protein L211DRAFT_837530 [Terfezia boudieri ATCC MYA-4762]